jgi:hypothetical protein
MAPGVLFLRNSASSILWTAVLFCSVCFVFTAILAVFFRRSGLWRIAVWLIAADLLSGATLAVLDHLGYAH